MTVRVSPTVYHLDDEDGTFPLKYITKCFLV